MRGGIRIAAVVALGVVVAGCSHDDNNASGSTTTTAKAPWDACSVSPSALQAAGVDPATMEKGLYGKELPNSTTCEWTGKDYDIYITASSTATAEEVRTRDGNNTVKDVSVAGRPAFTYKTGVRTYDNTCFLAVPFQTGGLAYLQISRSGVSADQTTPTCDTAARVGNILAAEMPQ